MTRSCLLALASATILTACGADKPAPSEKPLEPAASADTATPPVPTAPTPAPSVAPQATSAPTPAKRPEPSSPAARPAPTATTPVQPAPAPAPVVAKPAAEPAPQPTPAAPPAAAPSADPLVGKPIYEANCRKCHGVIGVPAKAIKAKFPKILPFDADYFSRTTDDAVVAILMQGKGDDMKPFKETLSKSEMVAVAAYIRTLGKR